MDEEVNPLDAIKEIAQNTTNSTYQFQLNAAAIELTKISLENNVPAKQVIKRFNEISCLLRGKG